MNLVGICSNLIQWNVERPKLENAEIGKRRNRKTPKSENAEIQVLRVGSGLKISINVSKNQTFGNRQFELKPNNFGPNCPKNEHFMSKIPTFCPIGPYERSDFRRSQTSEN